MKTKSFMYLAFTCFLLLSFSTMEAQSKTSKVEKRQVNQQKRIKQGINSGELTFKEVHKLVQQQKQVKRTKIRAKSDGVVTKHERAKIAMMQNRASKNIYRKKHNRRDR